MKPKDEVIEYEEKLFKDKLKELNVILGIFYIALGFGILLGWVTKGLMILLDPIPDQFIYLFINFSGWIPEENMIRIQNPDFALYPYEKSIYYAISYTSFLGFCGIIMELRFMILYANRTHSTSLNLFLFGLIDCIFTGFTTFMRMFL